MIYMQFMSCGRFSIRIFVAVVVVEIGFFAEGVEAVDLMEYVDSRYVGIGAEVEFFGEFCGFRGVVA